MICGFISTLYQKDEVYHHEYDVLIEGSRHKEPDDNEANPAPNGLEQLFEDFEANQLLQRLNSSKSQMTMFEIDDIKIRFKYIGLHDEDILNRGYFQLVFSSPDKRAQSEYQQPNAKRQRGSMDGDVTKPRLSVEEVLNQQQFELDDSEDENGDNNEPEEQRDEEENGDDETSCLTPSNEDSDGDFNRKVPEID